MTNFGWGIVLLSEYGYTFTKPDKIFNMADGAGAWGG